MKTGIIEHTRLGPCRVELSFEGPDNTFMWFIRSSSKIDYIHRYGGRYKYEINKTHSNKDWFYILIGVSSNIEEAGIIPLITKTNKSMCEAKAIKQFIKATKLAGTKITFKNINYGKTE